MFTRLTTVTLMTKGPQVNGIGPQVSGISPQVSGTANRGQKRQYKVT